MTWNGYFELGGNEVINVARTEAYAKVMPWFKPIFRNDVLGPMLGHKPYRSPLQDDAPWTDPDNLDSYDFFGVYPLNVTGIEDSTRTSTVVESLGEGGVTGRIRHATRQMPFSVVLLGATDAAVAYGMKWLRRVLLDGPCGAGSDCFGNSLCYLESEPHMEVPVVPDGAQAAVLSGGSATADVDSPVLSGGSATTDPGDTFSGGDSSDSVPLLTRSQSIFTVGKVAQDNPLDCLVPYSRSLRSVSVNNGPTLTGKVPLSQGAAWTVTFTAVAGLPFEMGPELEVVRGFLDPAVTNAWADGIDEESDAAMDVTGYMVSDYEAPCTPVITPPLFDPTHPAIILPPTAPSVPLGHYDPPVNWRRRQFTIPKRYIPLFGEVVPVARVHARMAELRNLRLRFYADPYETGSTLDDPCAFCGDIVISYVPQGYTLVFDGADETVTAIAPGGVEQRADSLVFSTDGSPFEWPRLTCGSAFIVAVDLPEQQATPVLDLSLHERIV